MAYSTATKEMLVQLGAKLRSLRQEAHYSQEKVAGMILGKRKMRTEQFQLDIVCTLF